MEIVVGLAIMAAAIGLGLLLRSRRTLPAPTQGRHAFPRQLDRDDFESKAPWLVAVFTSATCETCADIARKAEVLAASEVGVVQIEFGAERRLHSKYAIEAVPIVVIADREGVVRFGHAGPLSATDLWAAFATVRESGDSESS